MAKFFAIPEIPGFRLDRSGYSPAYFPMSINPVVSNIEIRQLAEITLETKRSARICLHSSREDTLHYMVIAQYRGFDPDQPLCRMFPAKQKVFQPLLGRLFWSAYLMEETSKANIFWTPLIKTSNSLDQGRSMQT